MPNRIIKESVCTSETIDKMSWFEECFFHRLWTACDDYGRMDARPTILKARLFPLKDRLSLKDINDALYKLADIGCVRLYECDSKPYLYLPSWEVHQVIRAKKSKYPAPDSTCNQMISYDIKCLRNPIQSESESNPNPTTNPTRACEPSSAQTLGTKRPYGWGVPPAGTAVAAYLDRVNPSASQQSLALLAAYERDMGMEVCLRAIDIALDNRKATWAYIKAILQRWSASGVKCIADIEALEAQHEAQKKSGGKYKPGAGGTAPQPCQPGEADRRAREDMERLRNMMREEREGDHEEKG